MIVAILRKTGQTEDSLGLYFDPFFFSGFVKVGGYNGLWEDYENAMGKPYVAQSTVMTTLATNVSTTAATLATTMANITTILPTNTTSNPGCFKLTPYWGNMFRPLDDPDYPWLGLWITLPIMGVWYWCTDQVRLVSLTACYFHSLPLLGLRVGRRSVDDVINSRRKLNE